MPLATADEMNEARRRNVNATELAMKPAAYDPARLPQRMGFELKVDGIGFLDVNGTLQSLEGVDFHAALHLANELAAIRQAFGTEMVLHGEFIEAGGFNATLRAFRTGRSEGGGVVLWDAVTLKAWHGFEQSLPLYERREMLQAAFAAARPTMIALNPLMQCPSDPEIVEGALNKALQSGQEGIVVKDMDSPYQRGRNAYWMKVKDSVTVDVPLQAVRMDGERVKSIIVTLDGKPVVVGSGLSETLRLQLDEFWAGRMVEIRHVGRTDSGALRGASFVRFRDDKSKGGA